MTSEVTYHSEGGHGHDDESLSELHLECSIGCVQSMQLEDVSFFFPILGRFSFVRCFDDTTSNDLMILLTDKIYLSKV